MPAAEEIGDEPVELSPESAIGDPTTCGEAPEKSKCHTVA